jgi:DNA-directed RNA polymerase sigma subunit (sigma70/sigma32)
MGSRIHPLSPAAAGRLTAGEERALGRRWQQGGEAAARAALIERNLPLVGALARPFLGRGLEWEDLVQEGAVGLCRAVDRWDPERGVRLGTYATYWVRQQLERAVRAQGERVRRPCHVHDRAGRVAACRQALGQEHSRAVTDAEVAERLGLSERAVRVTEPVRVVSLEALAEGRGEAGIWGPAAAADVAALALARLTAARRRQLLATRLLSQLSARDREVLERRLAGETLQAIGTRLGLSREGVRQIGERALSRLRRAAASLSEGEREELEG